MDKLTLLFVADGRSPIALNWMRYFVEQGHAVHLATTVPCRPVLSLASHQDVSLSPGRRSQDQPAEGRPGGLRATLRGWIPVGTRTRVRRWLVPLGLPGAARKLEAIVRQIQPDLVHAMRIPYEGVLAAAADPPSPLLVSVWGNDFTLHAAGNAWLARETRRMLPRADALHTDCQRDMRLAAAWGFPEGRPAIVLPGGGGVRMDIFHPPSDADRLAGAPETVINPRGVRAYVHNRAFFEAIPLVLARRPGTRFLCPGMAGERRIRAWVRGLGISDAVDLLPSLSPQEMAAAFRRSQVAVSPTSHDGTPNTLLEAMACGCFPIAGDLESLREWITPGENGLLVDPRRPGELAEAILQALDATSLRDRAREHNLRLVSERARYGAVMARAEAFYRRIARQTGS